MLTYRRCNLLEKLTLLRGGRWRVGHREGVDQRELVCQVRLAVAPRSSVNVNMFEQLSSQLRTQPLRPYESLESVTRLARLQVDRPRPVVQIKTTQGLSLHTRTLLSGHRHTHTHGAAVKACLNIHINLHFSCFHCDLCALLGTSRGDAPVCRHPHVLMYGRITLPPVLTHLVSHTHMA